jgi:hypothetical protein
MAKTLRITTFLIAAAALGLIILLSAKGIASNKDFETFLAVPGAAAQLQASGGVKVSDVEQQVTPLIAQAKAFSLRINPPPPPAPVNPEPPPEEAPRPQAPVTAKFTLVGTSYHMGDEKNSWALINEVGKGWHWVKESESIGHLIIEKIGDGVVLIRDSGNTYELSADREQKPDYVKSFSGTLDKTIVPWQSKQTSVKEAVSTDQSSVSSVEKPQSQSPEELKDKKKQVLENIDWIKKVQENPALVGMTAEEAKELGDLGEMLKGLEEELKVIESSEPNKTAEPNTVKIKDVNEQKSPPAVIEKQPQPEPNKAPPPLPKRPFRRDRR